MLMLRGRSQSGLDSDRIDEILDLILELYAGKHHKKYEPFPMLAVPLIS